MTDKVKLGDDDLSPEAQKVKKEFDEKQTQQKSEEDESLKKEEELKKKPEPEVKPEKVEPEIKPDQGPALEKREPRPIRTVPYGKFKSDRDKLKKELDLKEKEIAELKEKAEQTTTPSELEDTLKKFATESGSDFDSIKKLTSIIIKEARRGQPDLESRMDKFEKETQTSRQDRLFTEDMNKLIGDKSVSDEDKVSIKDNKEKINELAFTKGFENTSLYEIFHRYIKPNIKPKVKGGEPSRGGSQIDARAYNVENPTPEEIAAMPKKVFLKYIEKKKKQEGVSLRRSGRIIM